jgi:protein-disulfide isomerase
VAAPPVAATEFSDSQKTEIRSVVREYLVEHPEVLAETVAASERRQADGKAGERAAVVAMNADFFADASFAAVYGNPRGRTTVVEFFDYNCAFCKRSLADLVKLADGDGDLRVVVKDFPVLGLQSSEASVVASAVRMQAPDRAWEFHRRLLATRGRVGKEQALALARDMKLDFERLGRDIQSKAVSAGLARSVRVGGSLNLDGTPAFVVGSVVVDGAVGYDRLRSVVDGVRKCGKATC